MSGEAASGVDSWQAGSFEKDTVMKTSIQGYPSNEEPNKQYYFVSFIKKNML